MWRMSVESLAVMYMGFNKGIVAVLLEEKIEFCDKGVIEERINKF